MELVLKSLNSAYPIPFSFPQNMLHVSCIHVFLNCILLFGKQYFPAFRHISSSFLLQLMIG